MQAGMTPAGAENLIHPGRRHYSGSLAAARRCRRWAPPAGRLPGTGQAAD